MPIGEYKIGDEVTYNDINFYVIENSDTVTLLKKVENKDNNINSIDTKNDNNIINKVDVSNTLWNKSIFFVLGIFLVIISIVVIVLMKKR